MPYISKKNYLHLDSSIDWLVGETISHAPADTDLLLNTIVSVACLVADKVLPERRYHAFSLTRGVIADVADEMRARLDLPKTEHNPGLCYMPELDFAIESLAANIKCLAQRCRMKSPAADAIKSYDGTYSGFMNYSLTSFALRLTLKRFDEENIRPGKAGYDFLLKIPNAFYKAHEIFYLTRVRKYEEEQILKESNGDLWEYEKLRKILGIV